MRQKPLVDARSPLSLPVRSRFYSAAQFEERAQKPELKHSPHWSLWLGALSTALWGLGGCAGHSARTLDARRALDRGAPAEALQLYNDELDVASGKEQPNDPSGDNALLLLDRSLILQQLAEYQSSSKDLEVADKQIELLDFSTSAMEDIGKYIFSDDTGGYRAPPYEKLLINTMNIVNYLARHDLSGARVEARRLSIMQKYFRDNDTPGSGMVAPGSYFAGFVFEKSGRPDIAIRYYDEALQYGLFPSLLEPVRRLTELTGYRGKYTQKLLESAQSTGSSEAPAASTSATATLENTERAPGVDPAELKGSEASSNSNADEQRDAELLVIINYGRVPAKVAQRVPIGLALTWGALYLTNAQSAQANQLAAKGLVMWVNYPDLEQTTRTLQTPSVKIDGKYHIIENTLSVDEEARAAYEDAKGRIVASAITRLITRALAGEAIQATANDGAVGLLLNLGTQVALTAADTPDTRSWSTLPARIGVVRAVLPPGTHRVEVEAQGVRRSTEVRLQPGRWEAVNLTVLR